MSNKMHYNYEALTRYARALGFGEIHEKIDPHTGMHAIIAIHSNQLGPAIGGCRFKEYESASVALKDVLRLAYMMTLKAAVSGLPHGGAKAVILKPPHFDESKRQAYFESFGHFINEMNGRYITSVDVGTTNQDLDHTARVTSYVTGATGTNTYDADPSVHTALGVFYGIKAAIKHKLNRDNCDGLHVAVQGAGNVAYPLIKQLANEGAIISVCEPDIQKSQRVADEYGATIVALDDIYDVDCDVFAPCALGGIINNDTIARLQSPIIAGSANNQLAHSKYATTLAEKGILYAPDYVINAGGLMCASSCYLNHNTTTADKQVSTLYDTLLTLFARADNEQDTTTHIAERMAKENLSLKHHSKEVTA